MILIAETFQGVFCKLVILFIWAHKKLMQALFFKSKGALKVRITF